MLVLRVHNLFFHVIYRCHTVPCTIIIYPLFRNRATFTVLTWNDLWDLLLRVGPLHDARLGFDSARMTKIMTPIVEATEFLITCCLY